MDRLKQCLADTLGCGTVRLPVQHEGIHRPSHIIQACPAFNRYLTSIRIDLNLTSVSTIRITTSAIGDVAYGMQRRPAIRLTKLRLSNLA